MGSMSARSRHSVLVMLSVLAFTAPATARADAGSAGARAGRERALHRRRCAARPGGGRRPACRHAVPDERRAHGPRARAACRPSRCLSRVAAGYARQMVRGRFFDHTSPGGSTMLARIRATSYLRDVTLVVGRREPRVGHRRAGARRARPSRAWMHSPEHRANLLDRRFADVGIGVVAGAPIALEPGELGGTYMTDFGRRLRD